MSGRFADILFAWMTLFASASAIIGLGTLFAWLLLFGHFFWAALLVSAVISTALVFSLD